MTGQTKEAKKVTWKGWLSLIIFTVSLSGIFAKTGGPWSAIDFTVLVGDFGKIIDGVTFTGKGGNGAKEGFMFALTLIPAVMLAMGLIRVVESLGGLEAAEVAFRPILRPFMGIPGAAGLAFVGSFTSSDVGAVMTKGLVDDNLMTDDERTIFVSYQYPGSAFVANTISTGGALLPISVLPVGVIMAIIFVVKIMGCNLMRFYLFTLNRKQSAKEKGEENNG